MSLSGINKNMKPGPKRGRGKFKPSNIKTPTKITPQKPPPIGHRLSDSTNFSGFSHQIGPPIKSVKTAPMRQDENGNFQFLPNNGPKRGVLQGSSLTHNWQTIKSNKSKGPTIVPLMEDENGKFHFIPNEGPKRGISIGPSAFHINNMNVPNNGPKRGVGTMNIKGQISQDDQRAIDYVNEFRKENNLPPLQYSKLLSEIAMPHTLDMLNKKVPLGHSGFNERSAKVTSAMATGENVGYEYGYSDPMKTLFDGWLHSPPHRKNMLGNFNQIGVAFANKGDMWYGTQFFALI